jgi:hypothetical protein
LTTRKHVGRRQERVKRKEGRSTPTATSCLQRIQIPPQHLNMSTSTTFSLVSFSPISEPQGHSIDSPISIHSTPRSTLTEIDDEEVYPATAITHEVGGTQIDITYAPAQTIRQVIEEAAAAEKCPSPRDPNLDAYLNPEEHEYEAAFTVGAMEFLHLNKNLEDYKYWAWGASEIREHMLALEQIDYQLQKLTNSIRALHDSASDRDSIKQPMHDLITLRIELFNNYKNVFRKAYHRPGMHKKWAAGLNARRREAFRSGYHPRIPFEWIPFHIPYVNSPYSSEDTFEVCKWCYRDGHVKEECCYNKTASRRHKDRNTRDPDTRAIKKPRYTPYRRC